MQSDAAVTTELVPAEAIALPATVNAEALLATAIERNVPIETLERLLALREKLRAESARAAFFAALAAFQGTCPIIPKTKTAKITSASGGSYAYSYAPLEVIVSHVGALLQAHGLSVMFDTHVIEQPSALVVVCTVHHVAGHAETSEFRVPIDEKARMNDAQKVASASTYAKRYAFCNALGILTGDDDDDGHSGGAKDGEPTGGGPTDFRAPKRASAADATRAAGAKAAERLAKPAQGELPTKPADAISDGKVKRVYALIRTALERHGANDDTAVVAVDARLDDMAKADRGLASWKHVSWRDYESLCRGIDGVVDELWAAGKPAGRFVRRVRR